MERTLYLDTSFRYLTVGITINGEFSACTHYEAWQQQSEKTVPEIVAALAISGIVAKDLTRIVVAIGPGSYTGVRIGLTLAKVLAHALDLPLIPLSTLQVLSGPSGFQAAILDARSDRAYVGIYQDGKAVQEESIMTLPELHQWLKDHPDVRVVGDPSLVQHPPVEVDVLAHMQALADQEVALENVHRLKPHYLKG